MIIDFHTHSFPERIAARAVASLSRKSHTAPFSDGTEEALEERCRKAGIDLAVILPVATSPEQVEHVNERAAERNRSMAANAAAPGRLLSFAAIHPACEDAAAQLHKIKRMGFAGVKLHPVYQETDIDSLPYLRILEACAQEGLIAVTHAGWDIGFPGVEHCLPDKIRRAVRTVDPDGRTLRLVAAHMGGWRIWDKVADCLADTSVYLDTSFSTGAFVPLSGDPYYDGADLSLLDEEGFLTLVRAFGASRILFGTDSPWSGAEDSLQFLRELPLSEEDKAAILGENARALLEIGV